MLSGSYSFFFLIVTDILLILPQEYDDPNTIISNILHHVRQLGIVIDFAPSKLKQVKEIKFFTFLIKKYSTF